MKNENEFNNENLNFVVDGEKNELKKKHTIFFTIKIRW